MHLCGILVVLLVSWSPTCLGRNDKFSTGSVYLDRYGIPSFTPGVLDKEKAAAYVAFNDTLFSTGWDVLDVRAGYGPTYSDNEIMYAAGYAEGYITASQIHDHYLNMYAYFFDGKSPDLVQKVKNFLNSQDEWMRDNIAWYSEDDPLWRHASYIISQFDGLYRGFRDAADTSWDNDVFVVQLLNAAGDLFDLLDVLSPESRPQFDKMTKKQALQYMHAHTHCSVLVKVTGAYEKLFMSHNSWFTYMSMLRVYKHYNFNLADPSTSATGSSFSSYPGFLESLDDFYILNNGLVVLQTTNPVFNTSLFDQVHPQSLLAWHRVRIANQMARNGKEWAQVLSKYNSGTYNNQYMIIDLNQIHLNKSIDDNALWVAEQIPGHVTSGDQSKILRAGYWASYNVPFYEDIYNACGYPDMVKKHGPDFSHQLAPRAKIFRRDQDDVLDIKGMMYTMRYNDYKNDPYSENNSCNTICCRGDLGDNPDWFVFGCNDGKITDYDMALKRQSFAINGPTLGNNLGAFSWTGPFANYSHVGLPLKYTFDWQLMQPSLK